MSYPGDDMGHPDNITTDTFRSLGKKIGKKEPETRQWVFDYLDNQVKNPAFAKNADIEDMFMRASKAWGQSVKEVKKQTYSLLKSEM